MSLFPSKGFIIYLLEYMSIKTVTTRLVVLSNRLQFWKNWQKRRTPRQNVMGTTDRRGRLVPKHLENLKLGTKNRLSELCDGMAGRTVAGSRFMLS